MESVVNFFKRNICTTYIVRIWKYKIENRSYQNYWKKSNSSNDFYWTLHVSWIPNPNSVDYTKSIAKLLNILEVNYPNIFNKFISDIKKSANRKVTLEELYKTVKPLKLDYIVHKSIHIDNYIFDFKAGNLNDFHRNFYRFSTAKRMTHDIKIPHPIFMDVNKEEVSFDVAIMDYNLKPLDRLNLYKKHRDFLILKNKKQYD